jgi:hypothetical protein
VDPVADGVHGAMHAIGVSAGILVVGGDGVRCGKPRGGDVAIVAFPSVRVRVPPPA